MGILWKSKKFKKSDLEALLRLRCQVFFNETTQSQTSKWWEWQYEKNSQGPSFIYLATDIKDEAVLAGHYALISYQLKVGNQKVSAVQSLDTFVNPNYRNQGIFIGLAQETLAEATAKGIEVAFGFPNPNSFSGFVEKLSFSSPFRLYAYQRPLRMGWLTRRFSFLSFFRFFDQVRLLRPYRLKKPYELQEMTCIPKDWGSFIDTAQARFPLLINRSEEYIRWRYLECPDRSYSLFELRRESVLVGFSVLRINQEKGCLGVITDCMAVDHESWKQLLRISMEKIVERGAASALVYMHPDNPMAGLFRKLGFLRTKVSSAFIVRELNKSRHGTSLINPKNWFLMAGDTDYY